MKGVGQGMFLTASTLAMIGCQGCQQVPDLRQHAPVNRFESSQDRPLPLIDAAPRMSLTQGQTLNSPEISIAPVLGQTAPPSPVSIDFSKAPDVSALRLSGTPGVVGFESRRNAANILNPVRNVRDFDAEFAFSAADAQTGLGFDVAAVPRVSLSQDGSFEQRKFGGEIRIGQNFDQRGEDIESKSWYLFAGADGEALVYEPGGERSFTNSMALRDQVTVGDMQAGISFAQGPGQLSFSYIRREVEYRDRVAKGSETEDFAGISFTVRR